MWAVLSECWRVLKPTGSAFINLGDKRSGSGGHNNSGLRPGGTAAADMRAVRSVLGYSVRVQASRRNAPDGYNQAGYGRPKSKMLIPHRFAIGCEDGLADPEGKGWIVRQDICWAKVNSLPESVVDRCRDSHEFVFHLTKQERYFSAVDEIREPQVKPPTGDNGHKNVSGNGVAHRSFNYNAVNNPLGKLPGSVWTIPSEPLRVPEELGIEHFAAFPCALPLRCIKGWSPSGICVECGEGRRPVVEKSSTGRVRSDSGDGQRGLRGLPGYGDIARTPWAEGVGTAITGYACACPDASAPIRPAIVLDPFGGTGTTAAVARVLGRVGISVDLSSDYCRLAQWRIWESGDGERAVFGTRPPRQIEGQGSMFEGVA